MDPYLGGGAGRTGEVGLPQTSKASSTACQLYTLGASHRRHQRRHPPFPRPRPQPSNALPRHGTATAVAELKVMWPGEPVGDPSRGLTRDPGGYCRCCPCTGLSRNTFPAIVVCACCLVGREVIIDTRVPLARFWVRVDDAAEHHAHAHRDSDFEHGGDVPADPTYLFRCTNSPKST